MLSEKECDEILETLSPSEPFALFKLPDELIIEIIASRLQHNFGIPIKDKGGEYRSAYDILQDLARVWGATNNQW